MTQRFIRDFELTLQIGDDAIIVKPPFKIAFNVEKSLSKKLNKANIQLFNIEKSKRLRLAKDLDDNKKLPVILKVGYLSGMGVVFMGDVLEVVNTRRGADFATVIEALDGGQDYFTAYSNVAVRGGDAAITSMIKDMPNTQKGKITAQPKLVRPKILVGNPIRLIEQSLEPDQDYFIDNSQLHITNKDEVIDKQAPVITAKTGLINTPRKSDKLITFQTLINSELKLGGLCELISETAPHLNGILKIQCINYEGDSEGKNWLQTVNAKATKDYKAI